MVSALIYVLKLRGNVLFASEFGKNLNRRLVEPPHRRNNLSYIQEEKEKELTHIEKNHTHTFVQINIFKNI